MEQPKQYPDNVNMKPQLSTSQPGTNMTGKAGSPESSRQAGQAALNNSSAMYGSFPPAGGGGTGGGGGSTSIP